jgi:hypothetical protein
VPPSGDKDALRAFEKSLFAHGEGFHLVGGCGGAGGYVPQTPKDAGAVPVNKGFPTPWRIIEIPNGFSVNDATGRQLAVFYGRSDPNIAGHTGFLTIAEARQLAVTFAMLSNLNEFTKTRAPALGT